MKRLYKFAMSRIMPVIFALFLLTCGFACADEETVTPDISYSDMGTLNFIVNYVEKTDDGVTYSTPALQSNSKYYSYTVSGNYYGNYSSTTPSDTGNALSLTDGKSLSIDNVVFNNNTITTNIAGGSTYGSALYVGRGSTVVKLDGDFVGSKINQTSTGTGNYTNNAMGGAIYNYGTITEITGKFLDNSVIGYSTVTQTVSAYGGAIFNAYSGTIDSIQAVFAGNYASAEGTNYGFGYGAAIDNEGTIGEITNSQFISNISDARSSAAWNGNFARGALYNKGTITTLNADFYYNKTISRNTAYNAARGAAISNEGTITNLSGTFVGNYVYDDNLSTNSAYSRGFEAIGGAIYNYGTITNVDAKFVGNYTEINAVLGWQKAFGGAIGNYSNHSIGTITGDFVNNYTKSNLDNAAGGAIWNDGSITSIDGVSFTGNYSTSSVTAQGGAISNSGTVSDIKNSDFKDNYAISTGSSGAAQGGAVYNTGTMTFTADDYNSTFSGNYVQTNGGEKDYQAIYGGSGSAKFTFKAINGGSFTFDDKIAGVSGFDLVFTGDGTGSIKLNNSISGADVSIDNINLDLNFINESAETHALSSVTIDDTAAVTMKIDIDSANSTADMISLTSASDGVITIDKINYIDGKELSAGQKVQVLDGNSGVVLKLDDSLAGQRGASQGRVDVAASNSYLGEEATVDNTVNWDDTASDKYNVDVTTAEKFATSGLGLGKTDTEGDSIEMGGYLYDNYETETRFDHSVAKDVLVLLWQKETDEDRVFNFDSADNVYNLTEDLGTLTNGSLTINGVTDGSKSSTLNLNNRSGITISSSSQELSIKNVTISGLVGQFMNITAHADINLENITLSGSYAKKTATSSSSSNINGGAIYNSSYYVDNISGNFTGNYTSLSASASRSQIHGGLLYNSGRIKNISGTFTENYVVNNHTADYGYAYGGVIYNTGTITNIDADFSRNYAASYTSSTGYDSHSYGGAIYNGGTITTLNGTFTSNKADSTQYTSSYPSANGGAIYNSYRITTLGANFKGNYAYARKAYGGAIYNASTITDITGSSFEGNYTYSTGNYSYGGAIYNIDTIGNITNADFKNNYAANTSSNGYTRGGAIYTTKSMKFTADDYNSTFSGNYVQNGSSAAKDYQAIYMGNSSGVLTFDMKNGGTFTFNDKINGTSGYDIALTGDGTGKIIFNNTLEGSPDVTVENTTADFNYNDGAITTYTFNSIKSNTVNSTVTLALDINATNKTSDKFVTTNSSSGTITINNINWTNGSAPTESGWKVQILQTGSSNLQLSLAESLQGKEGEYLGTIDVSESEERVTEAGSVGSTVNWDDEVYDKREKDVTTADKYTTSGLGLGTTTTTYDSLVIGGDIFKNYVTETRSYEVKRDVLSMLNQLVTDDERNFNFDSGADIYTVTENMGTTTNGVININGVSNEETGEMSTIDMAGHSGFYVTGNTTFNAHNVNFTNASGGVFYVSGSGATADLSGSTFSGNYSGNYGGAVYNGIYATITSISGGNYKGNYATGGGGGGGAIYSGNYSTIGDISGSFEYNGATANAGGAIFADYYSTIGNITGSFTGNYAGGQGGGAIYANYATVGDISASFSGNYASANSGGAIYNNGGTIGNIEGTFTNNSASNSGGAIYMSGGTVGDITASFSENGVTSGYGGAIAISGGTIGDITGDFSGNYAGSGGAIFNAYGAVINSITGNFTNNTASNVGGAIYNNIGGWIGDIKGNFSYNSATNSPGGAIMNSYTIGNITGNFIGNYSGYGAGAIYNSGTIGTITDSFEGNYVMITFTSYSPTGGAIANYSSINDFYNSSFKNNYIIISSSTDTPLNSSSGGAIYNSGAQMHFTADNYNSTFSGNYVQTGSGDSAQKDNIALYSANSTGFEFETKNGGTFTFDDKLNGGTPYAVKLSGDGTGTVTFKDAVNNASISAQNVNVKFDYDDGKTTTYNMNSIVIGESAAATAQIDVDVQNMASDTFATGDVNGSTSSGIITIDSINWLNDKTTDNSDWVVQVIDMTAYSVSNPLTLQLSADLQGEKGDLVTSGETIATVSEQIAAITTPTIKWNDVISSCTLTTTTTADKYTTTGLGLTTTKTKNDSIKFGGYVYDNYQTSSVKSNEVTRDGLAALNQYKTNDERNFNFDSADNEYKVTENLGTTTNGTMNVNGVADEETGKTSTIDMQGHSGFNVTENSTLNIENTTIKNGSGNVIYLSNRGNTANLKNANFEGNYNIKTSSSSSVSVNGGAVNNYQYSTLNVNNGNYQGNYASAESTSTSTSNSAYAYGGAVYTGYKAKVTNLIANFKENFAKAKAASSNASANGGAVYTGNYSQVAEINGAFAGNYATADTTQGSGSAYASGGAVYNESFSEVDKINAAFSGNYAVAQSNSGSASTNGGAVNNSSYVTVGDVEGDFSGNYAVAQSNSGSANAKGGAMYNNGYATVGDVKGDFSGNYAAAQSSAQSSTSGAYAFGGAIYNEYSVKMGDITGDFTNNYASAKSDSYEADAYGGVIYNNSSATVGNLEGDFSGNYVAAQSTSSSAYAYGGAIFNCATIGNITGDFTNNYANAETSGSRSVYAYGGAINNTTNGTIGDITGNFSGNYASSESSGYSGNYGGAIYNNYGKVGNITGDFTGNYISATAGSGSANAYGGAIATSGTTGDIKGNFTGNYISAKSDSSPAYAYGGAIVNYTSIANITGDFTGNYASAASDYSANAYGGAIYNSGMITTLTGNFTGNYSGNYGGAIYNSGGGITTLIGDFTNNYSGNYGGAIANYSNISTLTGDFTGNYTGNYGGAIANYSSLGTLTSNFTNNRSGGNGGAISNWGGITSINGNFSQNSAAGTSDNSSENGDGGAIYSMTYVNSITGDFTSNNAANSGGAIYNNGSMNSVTGDFVNNHAGNYGGAIANYGGISTLTGNFTCNYSGNYGGAIANYNGIGDIKGDFTGNYTGNYGGAIYTNTTSSTLTITGATFSGNYVQNSDGTAKGGAIYVTSSAAAADSRGALNLVAEKDIVFTGNKANGESSAIHNAGGIINMDAKTGKIVFDDKITGEKLAVDEETTLTPEININKNATGTVTFNNTVSGNDINIYGGQINLASAEANGVQSNGDFDTDVNINMSGGVINTVDNEVRDYHAGNFTSDGGKLSIDIKTTTETPTADRYNVTLASGKISFADINFDDLPTQDTKVEVFKGDVENLEMADYTVMTSDNSIKLTQSQTDKGYLEYKTEAGKFNLKAAVDYADGDRKYIMKSDEHVEENLDTMMGDNSSLVIQGEGNTVQGNSYNGITVQQGQTLTVKDTNMQGFDNGVLNNSGTVNLTAQKNDVVISDAINGSSGVINVNASENTSGTSPKVEIKNTVSGNTVNLNSGTLALTTDKTTGTSAKFSDDSNLNINAGKISFIDESTNDTNLGNVTLNNDMQVELDANLATKEIDTISLNDINDNGHKINIVNINIIKPTKDKSFSISPVGEIKDETVRNKVVNAIDYTGGDVSYSPIYKYKVKYDADTAMLNFGLAGGSSKNYNSFNPSIFVAPVAAQLGGYLTQLNSYDEAFRNMDMYMLLTREQRQAMKFRNKTAASDSNLVYDPIIQRNENKSAWFRPYATFENVHLKGGPRVSNVAYGSFFGTESEIKELGNGWDGMWSAYIGYNGSHQAYQGNSIYQNGGTLGAAYMLYKGNFFTGLTVNVGANAAEASTRYGTDNFSMLMSGVASKTGYNFELFHGKFIIQPSYLMSYSFVNTFDYTNASGVRVNSDPLHAIQIEPGIKFIANLKHGLQPYFGVSMVWNIIDKTKFMANDVYLPELSISPFVKYGFGLRKVWGEHFTGFIQAYLTNGGRNGIGLQVGGRYLFDN